jgi:hypothetical protein
LTINSHIAAKCQSSPPASQPPSVTERGNVKPNSGEALYICHPDMIIRTIAKALVQCSARTQAG